VRRNPERLQAGSPRQEFFTFFDTNTESHNIDYERLAAVRAERRRMAREIHDTVGQGLSGILLQLEIAENALATNSDEAQAHLERARRLARISLAETRRAVSELRSPALQPGELARAIADLLSDTGACSHLEAKFFVYGEVRPLLAEVEHNLFRITQEALTNVMKHANASNVLVVLRFGATQLELSIEDDGRGIQKAASGGSGIMIFRERAHSIGAELTVKSRPRKGVRIEVTLPLSNNETSANQRGADENAGDGASAVARRCDHRSGAGHATIESLQ
jgi:signal transduction histidine kinase